MLKIHYVFLLCSIYFILLKNCHIVNAYRLGYSRILDAIKDKDDDLRYDASLDSKGKLHLFWDLDIVEEKVTFRLEALIQPQETLAFGFSDYGEPQNADLVVYWRDALGRRHFQDAHTNALGELHVDSEQNYVLEDVTVSWEKTTITFTRKYDTCDDDDYVIDAGTTHLIFFTGKGPLPSIIGVNVEKEKPELQRVQLLKSQLSDPEFPEDTETFTMNVKNVEIPAQETTYWCNTQKLPELKGKHHIIQFTGAISPQSEGIVHHLEVFHCEVPKGTKVPEYNRACRLGMGEERPKGLEICRKVIGAWAMGAKGVTYPEEAGYPIGGENFSPFVMIEVHYNNPGKKSGVIDSSGIKFQVTKTLRQHDAGIMEIGLEYTDKYAIPPELDLWGISGYCIPECTQVGLKDGGINVFASQLHTHQTGKQVFTKHYRNGIELPELNRDDHYSPHYQEIRKLNRQIHILPGDALATTCMDSTAGKKNVVLGGYSISDEMCVNYIHYYPKVDLEVCKSSVTTQSLYGFFNFLNQYENERTSKNKGISDNYKSVHWTPLNVRLLDKFYETAPLSMQCNQSDGSRFPLEPGARKLAGDWEDMEIPDVKLPMPPSERPCLQ